MKPGHPRTQFTNAALAMIRYDCRRDECLARNGTQGDMQEGMGKGSIRNVKGGSWGGAPKHNFPALLRASHDLPSRHDFALVFLPRKPGCSQVDSSFVHLCAILSCLV